MISALKKAWSAIRLPLCNTFIVVVVALILIDALPFMPRGLRALTDPLMQKTGLAQGEWSMFSPQPDQKNTRFSAQIEFASGELGQWNSPAWREMPVWRSFTQSRYREFFDNLDHPVSEPARPGLADHIARIADPAKGPCRKVTIWIETAEIPDPREKPWLPMAQPIGYGEPRRLVEREYP